MFFKSITHAKNITSLLAVADDVITAYSLKRN